ncbi:MAG: hypothetical protein IJK81_07175 [Selenomonadaceae bacterium]|nr:hypothetical protein [Selenomonadaceae bacterium]
MIPVIIGAALAAGAGVGFALGKNDKPKKVVVNNVIQKAEVSEDYVKWQLDRAGKDLRETPTQSSEMRFVKGNDFNEDFERIDNMLSKGCALYSIKNELQLIELRAKNRRDVTAMNTIADYYDQIGNYQKAWYCREALKTF